MPQELEVILSSWIIQDENYSDFHKGQRAHFALDFFATESLTFIDPDPAGARIIRSLRAGSYEVVAQVVFVSDECWVLDIGGVLAYQHYNLPDSVEVGQFLKGTVALGIDCFDYFEELGALPNMPALIYSWQISRIEIDATPLVESTDPESGVTTGCRDHRAESRFSEIDRTDAWQDGASYVLHCQLLPDSPTNEMPDIRQGQTPQS